MPFNEEIVVRAAAEIGDPADLGGWPRDRQPRSSISPATVARRRPSAAAEMAVPVRLDLRAEIAAKAGRLSGSLARLFCRPAHPSRRAGAWPARSARPHRCQGASARRSQLSDSASRSNRGLRLWRGEIATLGARLRHPRQQIDEKKRAPLRIRAACAPCLRAFSSRSSGRRIGRTSPSGLARRCAAGPNSSARRGSDSPTTRRASTVPPNGCCANRRERLDNLGGRLESHALSHQKRAAPRLCRGARCQARGDHQRRRDPRGKWR